jgi:hypothetical protein
MAFRVLIIGGTGQVGAAESCGANPRIKVITRKSTPFARAQQAGACVDHRCSKLNFVDEDDSPGVSGEKVSSAACKLVII